MAVDGHWIYQGRQSHGWFGNGTAPKDEGDAAGEEAHEIFRPANANQRVDWAAYSILMHVPCNERSNWTRAASDTVREHLKTAVAAWYGASALSRDAFRTQFLDPYASDETVDRLRNAARTIVEGRSYDELAEAGEDIATVAQTVGAGRWPRFARDADHRAAEAVSRGDIPGVVKASVATEAVELARKAWPLVLGGLSILWGRSQSSTSGPTKTVPSAPLPSSPTVMQHDGPEEADPADGKEAPADGSKQPQAPAAEPVKTKGGRLDLPANPDDLLKEGWVETTHPKAAETGRRTFENPQTGEKIAFDKGRLGETGFKKMDHYHRFNPNETGKRDANLDVNGNPVPDNSKKSHIIPGK